MPRLAEPMNNKPCENKAEVRSRLLKPSELSYEERKIWTEYLAAQHPEGQAFLSLAFCAAAEKAYGSVEVCLIEDSEGIAAIFPFQLDRRIGKATRAALRVGEEMSDAFGVVLRQGFHLDSQELMKHSKLSYVRFTHLLDSHVHSSLRGETEQIGLTIALPNGGEHYWSEVKLRDPKFASDTDRRLRKAEQEFGPSRFCYNAKSDRELVAKLISEKRMQYLRTRGTDWLSRTERRYLLQHVLDHEDQDCLPVLSTLYFGDTWAAMHFGLQSRSTLHYWFPVYNVELSKFAPGRLLLREVIRDASRHGIATINRGQGETAAKQDFPSNLQRFFSGEWIRPGLASLTYRSVQSVSWRLQKIASTTPRNPGTIGFDSTRAEDGPRNK